MTLNNTVIIIFQYPISLWIDLCCLEKKVFPFTRLCWSQNNVGCIIYIKNSFSLTGTAFQCIVIGCMQFIFPIGKCCSGWQPEVDDNFITLVGQGQEMAVIYPITIKQTPFKLGCWPLWHVESVLATLTQYF